MSVQILVGDALSALRSLPDQYIHCCVTSPPYYGLRDYGVEGQIGLEPTPEEYIGRLVEVFAEVRRALRDDGTLWVNIGDSYASRCGSCAPQGGAQFQNRTRGREPIGRSLGFYGGDIKPKDLIGIPWMLAFALRSDGWYLRSDIIWAKGNPMPESVTDRPTRAHEYLFLLSKSARYYYDAEAIKEPLQTDPKENYPARARIVGRNQQCFSQARGNDRDKSGGFPPNGAGRNCRSVWAINTRPFPDAHFATFPPALPERCIKAATSERGCCRGCGVQWERRVEKQPMRISRSQRGEAIGAAFCGGRTASSGTMIAPPTTKTLGWQPACFCKEEPAPCVVLDPFAGAGTTGVVADRLGRDAVLVELNPQYAEMARRRIYEDAPLFAQLQEDAP